MLQRRRADPPGPARRRTGRCAGPSRSSRTPSSTCAPSRRHWPTLRPNAAGAPEQEAAIAALEEQRDLRLRRRDVQRTELASLQDGVSTATREPRCRTTARPRRRSADDVTRDGPQRRDHTLAGPPRSRALRGRRSWPAARRRTASPARRSAPAARPTRGDRATRARSGGPAGEEPATSRSGRPGARRPGTPLLVRRRVPEMGRMKRVPAERPTSTSKSAPAPSPAEPSAENEGDTSQDVLAELRDRAEQVARRGPERGGGAHGPAGSGGPRRGAGGGRAAAPPGRGRRARRSGLGETPRIARWSRPPGPGRRMPGLTSGVRTASDPTRWMRPPCPPAARPPRPTSTSPRERRRTATPRNSGRRRGSEVRRSSSATSARIESRRTTDLRGPAPRPIPASCAGASIPGPRLGVRPRRRLTTTGPPRPQIQLPRQGSDRRRGSGTRRTSDGRAAGMHRSATTPRRRRPAEDKKDADDEEAVEKHPAGDGLWAGRA